MGGGGGGGEGLKVTGVFCTSFDTCAAPETRDW